MNFRKENIFKNQDEKYLKLAASYIKEKKRLQECALFSIVNRKKIMDISRKISVTSINNIDEAIELLAKRITLRKMKKMEMN